VPTIKRSEKLPDDQQRHEQAHDMDDVADDPADRAFGFARLKAMPAFGRPGFNAGDGPIGQAPWFPGSEFTLTSSFAPMAGFRCAKG